MDNFNVIIIAVAFVLAMGAIYILYAIIMYQGGRNGKGNELQLSTKNILEQVEILFEKQEYSLVQLLASKYLDRVPSHQAVRNYLAQAYFKDRKYNNAINYILSSHFPMLNYALNYIMIFIPIVLIFRNDKSY